MSGDGQNEPLVNLAAEARIEKYEADVQAIYPKVPLQDIRAALDPTCPKEKFDAIVISASRCHDDSLVAVFSAEKDYYKIDARVTQEQRPIIKALDELNLMLFQIKKTGLAEEPKEEVKASENVAWVPTLCASRI